MKKKNNACSPKVAIGIGTLFFITMCISLALDASKAMAGEKNRKSRLEVEAVKRSAELDRYLTLSPLLEIKNAYDKIFLSGSFKMLVIKHGMEASKFQKKDVTIEEAIESVVTKDVSARMIAVQIMDQVCKEQDRSSCSLLTKIKETNRDLAGEK